MPIDAANSELIMTNSKIMLVSSTYLSDKLYITVHKIEKDNVIYFTLTNTKIYLTGTVYDSYITCNNNQIILNYPPIIINNEIYFPFRNIIKLFGFIVIWNSKNKMANIIKSNGLIISIVSPDFNNLIFSSWIKINKNINRSFVFTLQKECIVHLIIKHKDIWHQSFKNPISSNTVICGLHACDLTGEGYDELVICTLSADSAVNSQYYLLKWNGNKFMRIINYYNKDIGENFDYISIPISNSISDVMALQKPCESSAKIFVYYLVWGVNSARFKIDTFSFINGRFILISTRISKRTYTQQYTGDPLKIFGIIGAKRLLDFINTQITIHR